MQSPRFDVPRPVWRWAFYDFANSSYVLIYGSFLLPVYFSTVLAAKGALSSWGWANGLSTLIGIIFSIIVGNYADRHKRISAFRWSVYGSCAGMAILSLAVGYAHQYVFPLYVVTNSIFILSLSLSDSILPWVASEGKAYKYSGFAWGFGYLGGITSLVIVIGLQRFLGEYSSGVFLSVGIFYLAFSIYALRGLESVRLNEPPKISRKEVIPKSRKFVLFVGYWLISECITVIILFYSIYASRELHLSTFAIGVTLLVVQVVAFPATWLGGWLAKGVDHLILLGVTILLWGIVIALLVADLGMIGLAAVVFLTGLVIGNSQSILRAEYSTIIDKNESGFEFGLYSVVSKAAVLVGPVVYGIASDRLNSQKLPLLTLFALMVLGYIIVWFVIRNIPQAKMRVGAQS